MKVQATRQFDAALERLKNPRLEGRVLEVIENLEAASTLKDVPQIKKLQGYKTAFRIRLGDFRLGFHYDGDFVTLDFIGLRKDFYRHFP